MQWANDTFSFNPKEWLKVQSTDQQILGIYFPVIGWILNKKMGGTVLIFELINSLWFVQDL